MLQLELGIWEERTVGYPLHFRKRVQCDNFETRKSIMLSPTSNSLIIERVEAIATGFSKLPYMIELNCALKVYRHWYESTSELSKNTDNFSIRNK